MVAVALAGPAHAQIGNGNGPVEGSAKGSSLSAGVTHTRIVVTGAGGPVAGRGNLTASDAHWTPPVCWYEPVATPKQFKAGVDALRKSDEGLAPVATYLYWAPELFDRYYGKKSDISPYDDYNLAGQGKGMWWRGVINPYRMADWTPDDCTDLMFWAPNGTAPRRPDAVSPEVLAEYAYDSVTVPDMKVSMNPAGRQTVNLPTWMWLNPSELTPVSVTATLPGTDLWATTTATPVSLHIDPGTTDATVYPASGDCPIDAHGGIGVPHARGDTGDPPCGVAYHRSTDGAGPYRLTTTVTWKISWTGTGHPVPVGLPDGVSTTPQDIDVREIQTVVR